MSCSCFKVVLLQEQAKAAQYHSRKALSPFTICKLLDICLMVGACEDVDSTRTPDMFFKSKTCHMLNFSKLEVCIQLPRLRIYVTMRTYMSCLMTMHTYISCVLKSKTTSLTISVSKQDRESGKPDAKNLQKTTLDNSLLAQHKCITTEIRFHQAP